jgi:L-ascorbate metabolism protein UlaG (beta-lactamase superfamily)
MGDTALFGDMALIGEVYKPQVVCVPVGDRFTMGPALGKRAAELVKAKTAIPIHWGTWPPITSDLSAFKPQGVEVRQMKPGETWRCG